VGSLLISHKFQTIYFIFAASLALVLFCLCFQEVRYHQGVWAQQQSALAFKQQNEWQRKQAQIGQDLLVLAQPILLDTRLMTDIKAIFREQQNNPSLNIEKKQQHHDQLYRQMEFYWQKMQEQGVSEFNLHFTPGISVVIMENPRMLSDSLGQSRPEITEVFTHGKPAILFATSRQGTANRLLIPVKDENKVVAVIELAIRLETKSSAAALLHKHIADVLLWDQKRKQMHPTLVGDWRLEVAFEPVGGWWQQGLIVIEQQEQLIKTPEGIFLASWINHSTRRLALIIWTDITAEYNHHQQILRDTYLKWGVLLLVLQSLLYFIFRLLVKYQRQEKENYQRLLTDEHKLTEQNSARLALALRSTDSGFWEWDIVKNRIRFSPEWRQLLKLPVGENEMDLVDWVNALDPNHRRSHHNDMMNHLKGLTPMFENEYRVKTGDGGYKWILSRGRVVERDASGKATLIVGVYTDVTYRKDAELFSVRQQAALQTLNEITSLPINDVDEQLKRALNLAAKYMGVTRAGISDISKKNFQYRSYIDVNEKMHMPDVTLENTFCSLVIDNKDMIAEDNMHKSIYAGHPALINGGHESYIGAPIIISGMIHGTLFFSAPKSRERPYDQLDKDFVYLLSRWAAAVIDRRIRDDEKKIIIERFKKLSEHLPGFLYQYQLRPDGSFFYPYASPGIYNIYGVTAEEVSHSAEKILDVIHPEELGWIAETVSYSASNLTPWVATVRVNNPNRGLVWTHVQSIPEKLDDGSVLWHGYVSDITSLKNTELKLERANAMHQAILDAASVAMITMDANGTIKSFNRGAEVMLAYEASEIIDKKTPASFHVQEEIIERSKVLSSILGYQVQPGFDVFIAKVRDGEDDENEWTYVRKDGSTIPVLLTVSALRDKFGDITGYLSIARDISELKRIDKMKNEFVSTVSHELRTPLTSISGALGIVANGLVGELPEQANKMIKIAHNNSLRLIALVNDLLDMEKLLAGKIQFQMQRCSMMDLIRRSVESNAAYAAQHGVAYQINESSVDETVLVDAQRIQQVMANFLSNAAKFSPPGELIDIRCESGFGRVKVTVKDKGPGINDEFRNRIFQKFSQADSSDTRQKGGTGLGLAICKEMIEQMGGRIGFESVAGQGASFYFEFPCDIGNINFAKINHDLQKTKILIIEDEEAFAGYLKERFEDRGFSVDIAVDGNQGLKLLQLHSYDLVTLDLFLPDMHGIEILKDLRLRENSRNTKVPIPVVIISTDPDDGKNRMPEYLANSTAIYWIQKPMIDGEPMMTVDYALMLTKKLQAE
jgi:PAS domain S-box-containing protein